MYPIIKVDPALAHNFEPLGTKPKYWFRVEEDGPRQLFKAEQRGTGEDWAEKICCEFARLLGLPFVHYDLAVEIGTGKRGVVCESCIKDGESLIHGNEVLFALDDGYPKSDSRKYTVKAHTVGAVSEAINLLKLPPPRWVGNLPDGVSDALGVFSGYLLLDAWTANQDRHHQNWGVVHDGTDLRLAPTFDHGAALARNLSDTDRKERLDTKDQRRQIPAFAKRASSAIYADSAVKRPMSTYAAWRAFAAKCPLAADAWRAKLAEIDSDAIQAVLGEVPPDRMSAVCRDFTKRLLEENQKRILADREE